MPDSSTTWLVAGLGNPGRKYVKTRHNIGARVVSSIQSELNQQKFHTEKKLFARLSKGSHLLALPTTFMNESGKAIETIMNYYQIPPKQLLIVHDDKDFDFGVVKLQFDRSAAGHNGVQSVIDHLKSKSFWRLRIGIGASPQNQTKDYVLNKFTSLEEKLLHKEIIPNSLEIIMELVNRSESI